MNLRLIQQKTYDTLSSKLFIPNIICPNSVLTYKDQFQLSTFHYPICNRIPLTAYHWSIK